jgi:SNF2 family DNA or RNA helicase
MLKNIKTKRTSKLVPILHATSRCLLLSGTPALARPTELWPQLKILSTERDGWWDDEGEFVRKYVQRTSAIRRAELHTMLTGTVMIRRMKHNILKSLPSKRREKAIVDVVTDSMRGEFHKCMKLLREGKGVLAKIAKKQEIADVSPPVQAGIFTSEALKAEYNERYRERLYSLSNGVLTSQVLNEEEKKNTMEIASNRAKEEVDVWYKERVRELQNGLQEPEEEEEELDRKTILNRMYSLTAKAKIPMIAECVEKWLADPTKGKLCIFAHHIFVLDEIIKLAGLSNRQGSSKRFIRIDGSTAPKERQAQIKAFQTDPTLRVAVLGITAAGVAVTLTASSTVWFTELFWTPALMIQAEGKLCHNNKKSQKYELSELILTI